jgi:hypothetical protein
MKLIVRAFLALFVLATALLFVTTTSKHMVRPVYAQNGCSVATLEGPYEATLSGFGDPGREVTATGNAGKVPEAAVGVANFDHGKLSATFTLAEGGNVSTFADVGTYTVNEDCTATIYDTTRGGQFNMVLIGGGTEMFGVSANYAPAFLELRKQNVPAAGCSDAVLTGNYAFKLSVLDSPGNARNFNPGVTREMAAGVLTFNGSGTLSASYTLNYEEVVTVVQGDKGTYTVNSDCTGSFTDSTAGLDFNIVIVNGGAELFAIQSDTGYVSLLQAKMQ